MFMALCSGGLTISASWVYQCFVHTLYGHGFSVKNLYAYMQTPFINMVLVYMYMYTHVYIYTRIHAYTYSPHNDWAAGCTAVAATRLDRCSPSVCL